MKALILANGEPPSQTLLARLAAEHDLFLAVDGAALTAVRLGVPPDIVSGDFDSLDLEAAKLLLPDAEFVPTPDQNAADLEKALGIAQARGADFVTLIGAVGRRLDHTLGTLALLLAPRPGLTLSLVENGSETRAVTSEWRLQTRPGDVVSLVSLDGQATVTTAGVEWPLTEARLPVGTRGISNRATGQEVTISVDGGVVIACHLDSAWAAHP